MSRQFQEVEIEFSNSLITDSCSSYPTRASYSGQVDGFEKRVENTAVFENPCLKRFQTRMQISLIYILIKQQKHVAINEKKIIYALISGHPRGLTPGNPRAFAPRHLQIPATQDQYSSTKSYHCPSPGEHN